jgi:hypothetical protein
MIFTFFRNTARAVHSINKKYSAPSMKITPMVKYSLGLLRFYLLFLVGLMIYKFISTLRR